MAAHTGLPEALERYWSRGGAGGEKIQWGVDGDFNRCRVLINEAIVKGGKPPLAPGTISGLCEELHEINNGGARPGHAPGEGHK